MEFINDIREGMALIAKGCKANGSWNHCDKCPFDGICDLIMQEYDGMTPSEVFETILEG